MAQQKVTTFLRLLAIILGVILVSLVSNIFFQQDEWHSFGLMLGYGKEYLTLGKTLWQSLLFDRIGARAVIYGMFSVFGLQSSAFGMISGLLHVLNAWLVYKLSYRISKHTMGSYLAGIFFLISISGQQAYSWFGTFAGTVPSVSFMLLSLLMYVKFLSEKKTKDLYVALLFALVSFFFKETFWFFFILYPLLWILFGNEKISFHSCISRVFPTIIIGVVITFFFARSVLTISGERANYVTPDRTGSVHLIERALLYPFEGIAQTFIPYPLMFDTARIITTIAFPSYTPETSEFDIFYQNTVTVWLVRIVSICLICLFIFFYKKIYMSVNLKKVYLTGLIFLPLSIFPYIVLAKFDAYLDSRYYYGPTVGAALLIGSVASYALQRKKLVLGILILFLLSHTIYTGAELISLVSVSRERKSFIEQITSLIPTIGDKTVFFVTGNTPGFYGIPELKVPFQSGLGHMLMVIYANKGQLRKQFLQEKTIAQALDVGFLYDTVGQGYREVSNQVFGYYFDKIELEEAIRQGKVSENNIVSLFYDADTKTLKRNVYKR